MAYLETYTRRDLGVVPCAYGLDDPACAGVIQQKYSAILCTHRGRNDHTDIEYYLGRTDQALLGANHAISRIQRLAISIKI